MQFKREDNIIGTVLGFNRINGSIETIAAEEKHSHHPL